MPGVTVGTVAPLAAQPTAVRVRALVLAAVDSGVPADLACRQVAGQLGLSSRRVRAALRPGELSMAPRRPAYDAVWTPVDAGRPSAPPPHRLLVQAVACVALFAIGWNPSLPARLTTVFVVVMASSPVWLGTLRRSRVAAMVVGAGVLVVAAGQVLSWHSSLDHSVDPRESIAAAVLVLGWFGAVGLLLWARTVLTLTAVALSYGAGSVLGGVPVAANNPEQWWKLGFALPVAVVVLALAARWRSTVPSLAALLLLALVATLNDYRSYVGFCVLTGGLVLWQARPTGRRANRLLPLALMVLLVVGGYYVGTAALTQGYLGRELQQRTLVQVENSGSLIAGGRPEWSATVKLMQEHPEGFGLGVVPNGADISAGKTGLLKLNIPTAGDYADHFMFNGKFKLHSITADLWALGGVVGLAVGGWLFVVIVLRLNGAVAHRHAPALVVFSTIAALWDLAFGTIYGNLGEVMFALSLLLVPVPGLHPAKAAHPVTAPGEPEHDRLLPDRGAHLPRG